MQFLKDGIAKLNIPYSYGFAIILLTVLVKLATYPLTKKQVRSCLHCSFIVRSFLFLLLVLSVGTSIILIMRSRMLACCQCVCGCVKLKHIYDFESSSWEGLAVASVLVWKLGNIIGRWGFWNR